jgi:hypothetical protein
MAAGRPPAGRGGGTASGEVTHGYEGHPDISGAQDRAWKRATQGRTAGEEMENKRRWKVRSRSPEAPLTPGPVNFYATK